LTVVKNKVNRPNACFTTLCQSTDFDDQSNLSPIVHVINQNFYYHQNFKEQIEDEFNRTLNEFEHTEPFNRPLLPKQQSSKKFFAMIEILNQFILPKFVNNTSFKKIHSIIQAD
jgi:uncharacterized protein YllA (UPF0747 family)